MRGEWKPAEMGTNLLSYEFYDAICKISSDKEFQNGEDTKPELKADILNDIKAAAKDPKLSDRMRELGKTKIPEWMEKNGL
jgi:hypothetical protein